VVQIGRPLEGGVHRRRGKLDWIRRYETALERRKTCKGSSIPGVWCCWAW
jgi:hypothetical protein